MDCKRFSSDDIWRLRDGISRLTALIESKGGPVQATPDAGAQLVLDTAALRSNHDLLRAGVVPDARGEQDITDDLRAIGRLRERNASDIVSLCSRLAQIVHLEAQSIKQEALSAAMLSPIRRLPPEILSVIFKYALTEKWKQNCIGQSSINIARVCLTWRAVALSTPQLWKYINIDIRLHSKRLWREAIETHLLRSGDIPLSIRLFFHSVERVPVSLQQAWSSLCSQSHRWDSLTVDTLTIPACFTNHSWPDQFLLLSHLHYINVSSHEPANFGALANAPITSMRLELTEPLSYVPVQLPALWLIDRLDIVCKTMRRIYLARYLPIISGCSTSLRCLNVAANQWDYAHPATLESIELPFLEHLKASGDGMRVCQVFTMPNLKSVSLSGYASSARRHDSCFLSCFANMLRSSSTGGQLRSLTLTSLAGVWRILEECLDLLPALFHLRIEKAPYIRFYNPIDIISRSLISILVRDTGNGRSMARLPVLTHLVMKFRSARGSAMGASKVALVREVVASRSQGCMYEGTDLAGLERFETDIPGDWTLPMSADVV